MPMKGREIKTGQREEMSYTLNRKKESRVMCSMMAPQNCPKLEIEWGHVDQLLCEAATRRINNVGKFFQSSNFQIELKCLPMDLSCWDT